MTSQALTLAGFPGSGTTQLAAFQSANGVRADGVMRSGGETQQLLSRIVAPQLDHLAGRDPRRPKAFTPPKPEMVARTLVLRPTTIRTFFQDERTLPNKLEYANAVGLQSGIGRRMEKIEKDKFLRVENRVGAPAGNASVRNRAKSNKNHYDVQATIEELLKIVQKPEVYFDLTTPEGREGFAAVKERLFRLQREAELVRRANSDTQGVIGRPTLDEGDSYSGYDTYGDPDGR